MTKSRAGFATAHITIYEMGGGAREILLDIVTEFRCRNDSGGIYKLTNFTLGYPTRYHYVVTNPGVGYDELGFLECFYCVEMRLTGY